MKFVRGERSGYEKKLSRERSIEREILGAKRSGRSSSGAGVRADQIGAHRDVRAMSQLGHVRTQSVSEPPSCEGFCGVEIYSNRVPRESAEERTVLVNFESDAIS